MFVFVYNEMSLAPPIVFHIHDFFRQWRIDLKFAIHVRLDLLYNIANITPKLRLLIIYY